MSYWDTSTLGKLYLPEPDSADFAQKAALDPAIATTRLALYEMRRVAFRKESEGFIQAGTAESALDQVNQDIAAGQPLALAAATSQQPPWNAVWFCTPERWTIARLVQVVWAGL